MVSLEECDNDSKEHVLYNNVVAEDILSDEELDSM